MQYKITLTDTGKKKVYVNPGVREGIYLYPGEIKKLRLEDGSELEQDEFERIRLEYALGWPSSCDADSTTVSVGRL